MMTMYKPIDVLIFLLMISPICTKCPTRILTDVSFEIDKSNKATKDGIRFIMEKDGETEESCKAACCKLSKLGSCDVFEHREDGNICFFFMCPDMDKCVGLTVDSKGATVGFVNVKEEESSKPSSTTTSSVGSNSTSTSLSPSSSTVTSTTTEEIVSDESFSTTTTSSTSSSSTTTTTTTTTSAEIEDFYVTTLNNEQDKAESVKPPEVATNQSSPTNTSFTILSVTSTQAKPNTSSSTASNSSSSVKPSLTVSTSKPNTTVATSKPNTPPTTKLNTPPPTNTSATTKPNTPPPTKPNTTSATSKSNTSTAKPNTTLSTSQAETSLSQPKPNTTSPPQSTTITTNTIYQSQELMANVSLTEQYLNTSVSPVQNETASKSQGSGKKIGITTVSSLNVTSPPDIVLLHTEKTVIPNNENATSETKNTSKFISSKEILGKKTYILDKGSEEVMKPQKEVINANQVLVQQNATSQTFVEHNVSGQTPGEHNETGTSETQNIKHHLVGPDNEVPSSLALSSALVSALSFGIILFMAVMVLVGKRCFDSWQRRHYSRMDYLINGMYN